MDPVAGERSIQLQKDYIPHVRSHSHGLAAVIPDFTNADKSLFMSEQEFLQSTENRMMRLLSKDASMANGLHYTGTPQNPGQFQPPTVEYRLYRKEVIAFMKIWRDQMFKSEGVTIIYRESPAYLDATVPLRIYTDNKHYINLSRCSMVINRQFDLEKLSKTNSTLEELSIWASKQGASERLQQKQPLENCSRKINSGY